MMPQRIECKARPADRCNGDRRQTQQQIAKALDIPRETVSNVLERFGQNGGTAKKTKPPPEIPDLFAAEPDGDFDWPLSGTVDDR
jgi:hypothetical protein